MSAVGELAVDDDKPKGILNEENSERLREAMAMFGAEYQRAAKACAEAAGKELAKFVAGIRRG